MANDFPEKGEFIAPHIARKKPDCDKRPLIPDPCEIRPGRRKASITDFDCVSTPDKIVCPSDFIAVYEPDEDPPTPPVLPPRATPGPTPPPVPTPAPPLVGNEKQTASCPTSPAEAENLICSANDSESFGPDESGNWPTVGSTIIVPENSFYAETQEEANRLAAEFACSNLECCFGNSEITGACESLVTSNDIDFLNDSGDWGDGSSDLVKGDDVTVPANAFVSCNNSAEADAEALEALNRVLAQTCYLCSPRLFCPCPAGSEPSEGYASEECLFQGPIGETTASELKQRAQDYLDNICECFERPDIADIPDLCIPEINLVNPNTQDCGGTLEPGTPTGKQVTDEDCEFDIEFPEIPCPCGITLDMFVKNPNWKPQDPGHDASQYFFSDPGGTAGNLTTELTDCGLDLDITFPEIPLGDIPPPPAAGGGGGGGPGLGGPCPEGITVEFCVDGKVKRTKPKKWFDPTKNDEDHVEDEENPDCQCRFCEPWSGAGGFTVGQIVAVTIDNSAPEDDASWRCFEIVKEIPSGEFIEPFKTPGWQNYFMTSYKKCGDEGTDCEQSKELEVEDVPTDEQGKPIKLGNDNDEDDPCTIKIPCIDVCSEIGVSNDVVEFTSEGQTIGTIALKKLYNESNPGAGGDCNNCPSWTGAGGFIVGEIISEICPDGDGNCCYEVIQDVPNGFYVRPGFPDDEGNQGNVSDYFTATSAGCNSEGLPLETSEDLGSNDASCIIALDANDMDFPVCNVLEASNDVIVCNMNGKEIGNIGLKKVADSGSDPGSFETWTGGANYVVGDKVEDSYYGCYEVIQNVNNVRPGEAVDWESYYTKVNCDGSGSCTFALVGNDIDFFTNDLCPDASNDKVEIKMNGKVKGTLQLESGPKINTESGDYEEIPGSCEIRLVAPNDIDLFVNDFCPETSTDKINIKLNGQTQGSIGITSGPAISDDGEYEEIPGSCEIQLTGNDIDLEFSSNDFCPRVTEDYVTINLNGEHQGTIELDTTNDCRVKLKGGPIDLSINDLDASCPEVTNDSIEVKLNGASQGTIGLTTEDCKVKLSGSDINLNVTSNDVDFCPEVSDSQYSVDVTGSDGETYGTITLGVDEDCKLTLTGSVSIPSLYNDDDSPYEEKDIEVCTPSGNETYTILVKKSG